MKPVRPKTPSGPPDPAGREGLRPVLGVFDATMIVMGSIIGAGVFQTPSVIARNIGSLSGVLFLWIAGGGVALCGALVFAELGAMMPRAGGEYVFLREGYGRFVAFLFGWLLLAAIVSSAIAYVSRVFVDHLEAVVRFADPAVSFGDGERRLIAFALIALMTLLNVLGVRLGATVQNVAMAAKIAGILLIVVLGAFAIAAGRSPAGGIGAELSGVGWTWAGAGGALMGIVFTYGGWQNVASVASEIRDPQWALPRGILAGTVAVVVLYVGMNWSLVAILGIEGVASSATPAAAAAEAMFRWGGPLVAGLVMISTFAITQVLLLVAPRIYFAMARDGVFFRAAGRVHPRFHTPYVAIACQGVFACAHLLVGRTLDLLQVTVIVDWLFFSLCAAALFILRRSRPGWPRPYRAWGYPWLPGIFLVSSVTVMISAMVSAEAVAIARAAATIAVGLVLYAVWSRSKGHTARS